MSRQRYPLLFSPLQIGPRMLKNRIVFSAHLTNYAVDGRPSAQHAAYYEARARGGAGLIITEEHSTHPTDWPYEKMIHGFDERVIPGYRAITDAVHRHDATILAQINHNGGQGSGQYSRLPVWAPSAMADPMFREVAKAVTADEIAEILKGYVRVARHCIEGGFDGVELQCSHSSIVRAFLSPATNQRNDAYGGPMRNRMRFLLELIGAIRDAVGPGAVVGVRLCGDELIPGGTTIEDAVEIARAIGEQGAVDYLNTSIGVATMNLYMIEASMAVPPGYAEFIPATLRNAVALPVVGVGRFKDPGQAERALAAGHCDLVGMVRAQIADPDLSRKALASRETEIKLCLSCNQECVGRMGLNRWLGCIENVRTGREAVLSPRPGPKKSILVAGGGPAGLEVAHTAAARGHRVVLCEAREQPGGQVAIAATAPYRAEFGDLVRNQIGACRRAGVEIRLATQVDEDYVRREAPDLVIVASGSIPARPYWVPDALANDRPIVCDVEDVLAGAVRPTGDVVVIDDVGFHQATSTAELVAQRGAQVTMLTSGMVVGQDLGVTLDLETWNRRAAALGIRQVTDVLVTALEPGGLALLHHPTGKRDHMPASFVVLAVPRRANDALYFGLKAAGVPTVRIGDCVAPRRAHAAVLDGHRVAMSL
jgi:2,4-dienoyl-CoA reductase (NADPH2)